MDKTLEVFSAGTRPEKRVNPFAVSAMKEIGIDISSHFPKSVDGFLNDEFDYVITVCGGAKESCPSFTGKVKNRLHIGFDDPADATGTDEEKMAVYRKIRDEIKKEFMSLYKEKKMNTNDEIKEIVRKKYAEIAVLNQDCGCSCCGTGETFDYTVMSDDYSKVDGYFKEADLGLGCGLPTEFAGIKSGNTVLDLGSGAGNDVFIARRTVGESGKLIGIDFTDEMIEKARLNCDKLGYNNVEFRKGDIEKMPVGACTIDVAISNCVLNLVPNKKKAFSEIFRVLKPGAHFCVSDIVIKGELPEKMMNAAAMYTGCVTGALQMDEYLNIIAESGFENTTIHKKKKISIPDEVLLDYISPEELLEFKNSATEILSITVNAEKVQSNCC